MNKESYDKEHSILYAEYLDDLHREKTRIRHSCPETNDAIANLWGEYKRQDKALRIKYNQPTKGER